MKKNEEAVSFGFNRRQVLKGLGSLSVLGLTGIGGYPLSAGHELSSVEDLYPKKDGQTIRLGIIGYGIRGQQLVKSSGFASPQWKNQVKAAAKKNKNDKRYEDYINQPSLNIEYTAVCDLFDVRAEAALDAVGKKAKRYMHYKELIHSEDVDAIIIATPDHWHAPMTIEAAKAGKHVYVEKCLTRTEEEVNEVYQAVQQSGIVLQLGHQLRHTESYHAAKEVIDKGLLGKISLIQTNSNRNSANGAWVYNIHPQANEKTIDWKQFNLPGKEMPFDADRFFRWRKYWDYGTGLCGDLMTHDFDAVNQIMGIGIPETVMASGGNYYWKDGREVPDVLQVSMEYPSKGFTYHYSATQANERHRPNIIMGDDATMEIGGQMAVYPDPRSKRFKEKLADGRMNPDVPIYSTQKREEVDGMSSATTKYFAKKGMMYTYQNGKRLDPTYLHIREWLDSIREGGTPSCNIQQAYEEAMAAHMAVKSYREGRKVSWDEQSKKIV